MTTPNTAEEWNWEYTKVCAADPAVHGQLLPNPQNIAFIQKVMDEQWNAAIEASVKCSNHCGPICQSLACIAQREMIERILKLTRPTKETP